MSPFIHTETLIDQHLATHGERTALLWEQDQPGKAVKVCIFECVCMCVCMHIYLCKLLNQYDVKKNNHGPDNDRNGERNEKRAAVSGRVMSPVDSTRPWFSHRRVSLPPLEVKGIVAYDNDRLEAIDFHP
jgi:hypothetical protein